MTKYLANRSQSTWSGTYLDANASERFRPEARVAALESIAVHGNPASVHGAGRAARRLLDDARDALAQGFGAEPDSVVFTSGATEANALAINGLRHGRRVLIGATEHDAVRVAAGDDAVTIPVTSDGIIAQDELAARLAEPGSPALVCLMLANNETGVLHPIAEIAALCRRYNALLHVDAVQAAMRVPVSLRALGASSLVLSGHKQGGLPGAGALLLAPGIELISSLFAGGGQELGRRGGMPPLPAIAAFAATLEAEPADHLGPLRDLIEQAAIEAGAIVCGGTAPRLPNTTCLALPGRPAASQLIALDLAGFAVSAGAACSSGKLGPSRVLQAMGLGALAGEAIRISLPWDATTTQATAFIEAYRAMAERRRG